MKKLVLQLWNGVYLLLPGIGVTHSGHQFPGGLKKGWLGRELQHVVEWEQGEVRGGGGSCWSDIITALQAPLMTEVTWQQAW